MAQTIHLRVSEEPQINLSVQGESTIPVSVEQIRIKWLNPDPYEGEYEVTPLRGETVVLNTAHHTLSQNVVVNPIPQNYGLITYNGNIITVS